MTTTPAPSRRRRRVVFWGLGVLVVAWLGWAAYSLLGAARHADAGLDRIAAVEGLSSGSTSALLDSTTAGDAASAVAAGHLRAASAEFTAANDEVSGPLLAPLRVVPVVGRQLDSVQKLSDSAATLSGSAATAYDEIATALDASGADPAARTTAVRSVGESLATLQGQVADLDLGPFAGLFPPLARARDQFAAQLDGLQGALDQAVPAARGTADFLEGPSSYLMLAANNAEMRAGSGMFLQAAPLQVDKGTFTFGDFAATEQLKLDTPGTTLDPDVAGNWSFLSPDREFRNVNLTPRFDESARMVADMWAATGRTPVEGVLAVDVLALQRLLEVVGPVEVPGADGAPPTTVTADNVRQELLFTQYVDFADDRDARRDRLGAVAAAVLEALNGSGVSAADLLQVFTDAGAGRNLLLWSSDPAQEEAWMAVGADGAPLAGDLGVWLVNRGGDKLDQFVDVAVALRDASGSATTSTSVADGDWPQHRYRLDVQLDNTAPVGLPPYIGGPHPDSTAPAGTYQGFLQFTVPGAASGFRVEGVPLETALIAQGPDGPSRVVAVWVEVPRGETKAVSLEFDLPEGTRQVRVLPSARPSAEVWTAGSRQWKDRKPTTVDLESLDG